MSGGQDPFRDVERLFDQLTQFDPTTGGDVPVDVVDEGDAFVVTADLPGYATEEIRVEMPDSQQLRIEAEFDRSESTESDEFVVRERHRQSVSRTVTLPEPVDEEETEAGYDNGVLTVRLGKRTGDSSGTDIAVN